jgi:hypothetical protein
MRRTTDKDSHADRFPREMGSKADAARRNQAAKRTVPIEQVANVRSQRRRHK